MSEEQNIPSQEEINDRQQKVMEYYQSQIPFLEIQKQYETLITELQELETRRAIAAMKVAQIMVASQEKGSDNDIDPPRKLKREE